MTNTPSLSANLVDGDPRRVGDLDIAAGPLAFGLWRFTDPDLATATGIVETALDAGMTLFDAADVYGLDWGGTGFGRNETILGEVLVADPTLRDRMILATKGGIMPPLPYDSSADYLHGAVDASLRRLRTDVIDLYLIHRPDFYSHPAAVAEALSSMRTAGKIREVGISNYTPSQHDALAAHLDFPIAAIQPQFSAAHLEPMRDGTLDRAMRDGALPMAWSPLAGGALVAENPSDRVRPELLAVLDRLAEREDTTRAAVAIAFVLAHPSRPVAIIGSQQPERITASRAALGVHLDRNDCYDIIEASEGVPLP